MGVQSDVSCWLNPLAVDGATPQWYAALCFRSDYGQRCARATNTPPLKPPLAGVCRNCAQRTMGDAQALSLNASRMYLSRKIVSLIPSPANSSGHMGTRMDTNLDTKRDIIYIGLASIGQMKHINKGTSGHHSGVRSCPIRIE
jgi:hypothetical protein